MKYLALLVLLAGCDHRKPIKVRVDAGPSVEVVEPNKRPAELPKQALVDEKEPDDDVAHAQPMEPGKGIRGTITAKDVDVFAWMDPNAPRDMGGFDYARVELTGVPGIDLALDVLDGDGKRLVTVNDGGPGEYEVIPNVGVDPARTYYLRVHEAGAPKGDATHAYELTVTAFKAAESDEREPNDDAAHATPVKLSSGTTGDASGFFGRKHDDDWLSVPFAGMPASATGLTMRLELAPPAEVATSLRVTGVGGKELFGEARGAKNDELRMRNVGVDAAAAAALIALRNVDGKSIDARWVLRFGIEARLDGTEREPNNDVAHATPLQLAGGGTAQLSGFLWPGDSDVYRVVGAAPESRLAFEVDGVDKVDLKLERLGSDGKSWVRADDAGVGQGEALPPAKAGDGLVRVSARARDTAFDAPYRLTATMTQAVPEEEREPNDGPTTATPWLPGAAAMRGRLAPRGDEDWYAFVAQAAGAGPGATATAGAHFSGPMPASVKIVDEGRRVVTPGTALVPGKRYFVVVKAAGEKTSNPRELYTVTLGP